MADAAARAAAVLPHRSVIVQAPAGSGKTTLLVERFLALLAVVDEPEEILAITFTRKAAAEMKQRILQYLRPEYSPQGAHEHAPIARARAIADKVAHWGLADNPQRLLIRTIDSFNHYLARTMPVASALGPVPSPADNTRALYRRAARRVLARLDTRDEIVDDLCTLLEWRDHRSQDVEDLLTELLPRREQWLRALAIAGGPDRDALEALLGTLVAQRLAECAARLEPALAAAGCSTTELMALGAFAANNRMDTVELAAWAPLADAADLPDADPAALGAWQLIADLFVTQQGTLRKTVNKTQGFPASTRERTRFIELLGYLQGNAGLENALAAIRTLPDPAYREDEWQVLKALVNVLKRSVAELQLLFARTGQTDFTGLASAALHGLGSAEDGFTDLGLYLDRRIRHILVDEFQDTNWGQLHLLEKLTAGWAPDDGHTLFLVGDPMQSIYRFREADVGLFIRSRDQGIGQVRLDSLRLTRNFRARAGIVDWVNERIGPIFPTVEDVSAGAVAYAPSEPGRADGGVVACRAFADQVAEADAIARQVTAALDRHRDDPAFRAAIIVRARSHLGAILPALERHGIPYRAVRLDPLLARPVVQDLLALTRVLLQPADRAALLAVLRAPFAGLTLADLHALAGDGHAPEDPDALARLTPDGRWRASRVFAALADAHTGWRRRSVRELVEGLWQRLGGPDCCVRPAPDLADAAAYLDALERAEADHLLEDWNDFAEALLDVYAEGDPPREDVRLEILTMHGAKGLEWDLVVLPALDRRPGGTDRTLLHWLPFTDEADREQVLLAPLRSAGERSNPALVQLIQGEQKRRDACEQQRLLYVAATRAREALVLTATVAPNPDGEIVPAAGSLLAILWPTTAAAFVASFEPADPVTNAPAPVPDQSLRRVEHGWEPVSADRLHWTPTLTTREPAVDLEFNWAGLEARRAGTALHRLLERTGRLGIEALTTAERVRILDRIPVLLSAMGCANEALVRTAAIVRDAFERTVDSAAGRWLLSARHAEAACELAVSGIVDGQLVNAVVDRTFVDADGTRWIIDYKSGYHAGADLATFLEQERERYAAQLERYRRLFQQLENRPVRTALYLPRHGRLEEVGGA